MWQLSTNYPICIGVRYIYCVLKILSEAGHSACATEVGLFHTLNERELGKFVFLLLWMSVVECDAGHISSFKPMTFGKTWDDSEFMTILIPHLHWFLRRWRPRRPNKGTSARDGTFLRRMNTHLVQYRKRKPRITNTLEDKYPKNMFKV